MFFNKQYYESPKDCNIIPGRILYMGTPYIINWIHPNYHIKKYFILVNNKKDNFITDLIISNCFHPNAINNEKSKFINIENPPKYSKFCLPEKVKKTKFIDDETFYDIIDGKIIKPCDYVITDKFLRIYFLSIWALDNPHHVPVREHIKTTPRLPFH